MADTEASLHAESMKIVKTLNHEHNVAMEMLRNELGRAKEFDLEAEKELAREQQTATKKQVVVMREQLLDKLTEEHEDALRDLREENCRLVDNASRTKENHSLELERMREDMTILFKERSAEAVKQNASESEKRLATAKELLELQLEQHHFDATALVQQAHIDDISRLKEIMSVEATGIQRRLRLKAVTQSYWSRNGICVAIRAWAFNMINRLHRQSRLLPSVRVVRSYTVVRNLCPYINVWYTESQKANCKHAHAASNHLAQIEYEASLKVELERNRIKEAAAESAHVTAMEETKLGLQKILEEEMVRNRETDALRSAKLKTIELRYKEASDKCKEHEHEWLVGSIRWAILAEVKLGLQVASSDITWQGMLNISEDAAEAAKGLIESNLMESREKESLLEVKVKQLQDELDALVKMGREMEVFKVT